MARYCRLSGSYTRGNGKKHVHSQNYNNCHSKRLRVLNTTVKIVLKFILYKSYRQQLTSAVVKLERLKRRGFRGIINIYVSPN